MPAEGLPADDASLAFAPASSAAAAAAGFSSCSTIALSSRSFFTAASTSSLVASPFLSASLRDRTVSPCAAAAALAAFTSISAVDDAVAVSAAESAKDDAGRTPWRTCAATTGRGRAPRCDPTVDAAKGAVALVGIVILAVDGRRALAARGARRRALVSASLRLIVSPPTATTVIERTDGVGEGAGATGGVGRRVTALSAVAEKGLFLLPFREEMEIRLWEIFC